MMAAPAPSPKITVTFLPLVLALYMCYDPVKKLGKVHGALKTAEAALDRIERFTN